MIKVGQIYKPKDDFIDGIVCVTNIYFYDNGLTEVDYIGNDGVCYAHDDIRFLTIHRKCVAEYPTWQEAVNSKEFKEINDDLL